MRRLMTIKLSILIIVCLCSKVYPQTDCYPNPPQILEYYVENVARLAVRKIVDEKVSPTDAVGQALNLNTLSMVLYAVSDAVAPDRSFGIYSLQAYQYIGETARTDKQIGASAKAEGTTSAVEKPGFATLLGMAIERGAIQQQVNSSNLTLSTTPYALVAAANRADTAELYQKYEFFNRVGLSASFSLNNQDQPLANVNAKQLTEWSIRLRLFGDRSARSKKFQQFWAKYIEPRIHDRLAVLVKGFSSLEREVTSGNKRFGDVIDDFQDSTKPKILDYINTHTSDTPEAKVAEIKRIILCQLKEKIVDPVRGGGLLSAELRDKINKELIPSLAAAHAALDQARKDFDAEWDKFTQGPLTTFAYTNHRTSTGSDYSEFKFLHEQKTLSPMKIVANAWVSIYSNPDPAKHQEQVRDFGGALSLEGQAKNPLASGVDLSKLTFAFTGSYEHMKENVGMTGKRPDIAVAQIKLEIPIRVGISIPLSFTYANATELIKEKHVRGNFGITFDVDKLFALTRRALNP